MSKIPHKIRFNFKLKEVELKEVELKEVEPKEEELKNLPEFTINKTYLGFHTGKDTLLYMLKNSSDELSAFQIAISPLQSFQSGKPFSLNDQMEIKKLREINNIFVVVHGKYIYNFCRANYLKTINVLIEEMKLANSINCDVIIHQGSNVEKLPIDEAISNYVNAIKKILFETNKIGLKNKIILENSSKEGNDIGYDLKTLSIIYNKFTFEEQQRIGFCIDLCHIFVAGELDVSNPEKVTIFFKDFHNLIGINKLSVIHFNDSNTKFSGCSDRHADIGHGYISKMGTDMSGFAEVKRIAHGYGIPMILETNCKHEPFVNQIIRVLSL